MDPIKQGLNNMLGGGGQKPPATDPLNKYLTDVIPQNGQPPATTPPAAPAKMDMDDPRYVEPDPLAPRPAAPDPLAPLPEQPEDLTQVAESMIPKKPAGPEFTPKKMSPIEAVLDVFLLGELSAANKRKNLEAAMEGWTENPLKAIQNIAKVDHKTAWELFDKYQDNKREDGIAKKTSVEIQDKGLDRMAALLGAAKTPEAYAKARGYAAKMAESYGVDLNKFPLPEEYNEEDIAIWRMAAVPVDKQIDDDREDRRDETLERQGDERIAITRDNVNRQDEDRDADRGLRDEDRDLDRGERRRHNEQTEDISRSKGGRKEKEDFMHGARPLKDPKTGEVRDYVKIAPGGRFGQVLRGNKVVTYRIENGRLVERLPQYDRILKD